MHYLILLETKFYYLEQYISNLLSLELSKLTPITLLILVISGLFTSLNPCFISLIPLGISSISNKKNNFNQNFLFIFGLICSLFILIIGTYYISYKYFWIIKALPTISSILIVILGLYLLKIVNIYILPIQIQNLIKTKNSSLRNILIGSIVGLTSTPCNTPILTTIVLWISSTSSFLIGLIYIGFYLIGIIIPLIAILFLINRYKSFNLFNRIWYYYIEFSGSIVLGIGILSFLSKTFA